VRVIEEPRQITTELPEVQGRDAEALIKEARSRQRKRWLSIGLAALILAVTSGIWASSSRSSGTKPTSSSKGQGHAKSPTITPPACRSSQLTPFLPVQGPATGAMADMRGDSVIVIDLRNAGSGGCNVSGWPAVQAFDPGTAKTTGTITRVVQGLFGTMNQTKVIVSAGGTAKFFLGFFATESICRGRAIPRIAPSAGACYTTPTIASKDLGPCPGDEIQVSPIVSSGTKIFGIVPRQP